MPLDLPLSQEPPFDLPRAHRWFAVEFNNIAWDAFETAELSDAARERMLDLAHAAALHWSQVGAPVNEVRAVILLAHVYARAGIAERADHYALRGRQLLQDCESAGPLDRALALGVSAWAKRLRGDDRGFDALWKEAADAGQQLPDADARELFEKYYGRLASPQ